MTIFSNVKEALKFENIEKNTLVTTCIPTKILCGVNFLCARQKIKPIKNKHYHFHGLSFICIGPYHQNHFG